MRTKTKGGVRITFVGNKWRETGKVGQFSQLVI